MDFMQPKRSAFTLVEILVVLAIIGILAALLFPAFNRVRENGRQAHCATNLKQLYMATRQYYDDEKRYPASIINLLPSETPLAQTPLGAVTETSGGSLGYYKGGLAGLKCLNDDTESAVPRSSYGNLTTELDLPGGSFKNGLTAAYEENTAIDPARYTWNYWGYDPSGWSFMDATEAAACSSNCPSTVKGGAFSSSPPANYFKYSLANRFAPPQTIITHCIYHRTSTSGARYPGDVGVANASISGGALGARDIILRLDGSTKSLDVTSFQSGTNEWQDPKF